MAKRWFAATAVIVVVAALGSGFALAHGGDASQIHGCVDKHGELSVIGGDESCPSNETSLDWSIVGPRGEQGETGPAGPAGPAGPPGAGGGARAENQEVIGSLRLAGFPGSIEILGFDSKISNTGSSAGAGGAGTGKASLSDFSITKAIDAATPVLALETARGRHFSDASIEIYRPGTTTAYMTYNLSDVLITLVHDHGAGVVGQQALEEIALNFRTIEWEFTPESGSPTDTCWDQARALAC